MQSVISTGRTITGKFFDMPKGVKVAPPQQSKLEEMWGKKKKREPESEVLSEDKMDVEKAGGRVYDFKLTCF